jgi:serine/threonine protein kinase
MVMLGTRLRMMPLWHPVDIRIVAGDDMDEEVIWLFKAAIVLDGLIYRELETIANNTPSTTATLTTDIHFPAVNEAARYRDGISAGTTLKFELEARIVSSDPHRFLYLAHDPLANCCVIVKFARSYSFELHTYLERKKRAPRLFGFQRLPGGWFVVVMEYLEKFDPLQLQVEDGAAFTSELEGELLALVHEMHDQNLVHGDLREANILVPREGTADELNRPFVIVDFDWGGEIGRAKFPDVRLNPHICVGDKRTRLVQRTDDTKTLSGMFERLRGVQSGM